MWHFLLPKSKANGPESPILNFILRFWNLFLTILSIFMLIGLVKALGLSLLNRGFEASLCDSDRKFWNGPTMFWIAIFTYSKYAELFDTVLLIVRNKPVLFLHWYHHMTVLAYTWFALSVQFAPGFFFGVINCAVHSIMYYYYYRMACNVYCSYSKVVTTIQIVQMAVGIAVTGLWFHFHSEDAAKCRSFSDTTVILVSSVLLYGSYLVLFAIFYVNRYCRGGQKSKGE